MAGPRPPAPARPHVIADGLVSDRWAPASPVTGRLDAFTWETPAELLAAPEPLRQEPESPPADLPAPPPPRCAQGGSRSEA